MHSECKSGIKKKLRQRRTKKVGRTEKKQGLMDLRDNTLRQGPPFHISLVLHVLDLLLQCVLVHVSEYTGIHGYSRASLLPDKSRIALAPLRKINRTDYVWGLLLLEHQTYVTDWQQEIRFCEEKCTNFSLVATSARWFNGSRFCFSYARDVRTVIARIEALHMYPISSRFVLY